MRRAVCRGYAGSSAAFARSRRSRSRGFGRHRALSGSQSLQFFLVGFRGCVMQIEKDTCKRLDRTGCLLIVDDSLECWLVGVRHLMLYIHERLGDGSLIRGRRLVFRNLLQRLLVSIGGEMIKSR